MAEIILSPPASAEAECAMLGSILIEGNMLNKVIEKVNNEDFYIEKNRIIWDEMIRIFSDSKKVDVVILTDYLKSSGKLEEIGGQEYLLRIIQSVPTFQNAVEYANIVHKKAFFRKMLEFCEEVKEMSLAEKEEVCEYATTKLFDCVSTLSADNVELLSKLIADNFKALSDMVESKKRYKGISTGFCELDKKLSGLTDGNLYFIAGRPAMGKTGFAINIAQNAAIKEGKNVLIFSLEMSKEELANRIISAEAQIPSTHIRNCNITENEFDRFLDIADPLGETYMYIDDTADMTVGRMRAKAKRMKIEKGIDLVVIDYIQLMSGTKGENRQAEISNISRGLKIMAKELNVPVIVISQLSRACEQRQDNRPVLSDLRESGAIEQDADVVMFLYREEYYKPLSEENRNVSEVIVAKHRAGSTGTIKVGFIGEYTSFYNL